MKQGMKLRDARITKGHEVPFLPLEVVAVGVLFAVFFILFLAEFGDVEQANVPFPDGFVRVG